MTQVFSVSRLDANDKLSSVDKFRDSVLKNIGGEDFLKPEEWRQAVCDVAHVLRRFNTATIYYLPPEGDSPADISIEGVTDKSIKDKDPAARIKAARKRLQSALNRRSLK